ncbi:MAG: UDP-N-acetylmuramate dehydrogenase [Bryobacteraceae bacterium]
MTLLDKIPNLRLERNASLRNYTRFGLGGPAALLADAPDEESFLSAHRAIGESGLPMEVIGGGSNLVVADTGFDGVVLRYTENRLTRENETVVAGAGAELQSLVDFSINEGLSGLHTMTGIPGWVGGAVYGNAGAYGRQMDQNVTVVRFFDGSQIRELDNAACDFRYRESAFKDNKKWVVFSATFLLTQGNAGELQNKAAEIRAVRDAKYPPTMKCAGSIFKNLIFAELPSSVQVQVDPAKVIHGKVPSAYFLELVGAKGMKNGDIHVADYHANLIYNAGNGTALQVRQIITDLKARVKARFGLAVQEEVQYIGF